MRICNNTKKLLTVLLTFMLVVCFNTNAFALTGILDDISLDDTTYVSENYSDNDYGVLEIASKNSSGASSGWSSGSYNAGSSNSSSSSSSSSNNSSSSSSSMSSSDVSVVLQILQTVMYLVPYKYRPLVAIVALLVGGVYIIKKKRR